MGNFLEVDSMLPQMRLLNSRIMSQRFRNRGYRTGIISDAMSRAQKADRKLLLQNKPRAKQLDQITFVLNYVPLASQIKSIIRKQWHVVKHLLEYTLPPRGGFRKTASIKNILVRTDICSNNNKKITVALGQF